MELIFLGTSAAWPTADAAATGMLLRHEGFHLVIDMGTGTFANLQRWIPHERIDAIAISHKHLDHCLDLYPLFLARTLRDEILPPVPLVSPPGVIDRIAALEDEVGARELRETFEVREIGPGEAFEVGPFHVETGLTPHQVPNMCMRIQVGDHTLMYTGDTGPDEVVETLARRADVLVAEASWLDGQERGRPSIHLTARQAGEHAARAGVSHLVLTHLWPGNDRDLAGVQAAEAFGGRLTVAEDHMQVDVTAAD